jgi:hypothetical protein
VFDFNRNGRPSCAFWSPLPRLAAGTMSEFVSCASSAVPPRATVPLVTIAWMFFRALSIGEFKNVSNGLVLGDYMDPSSDYPSFSEN